MTNRIEIPRYGGVCALRIGEELPEYLKPKIEKHKALLIANNNEVDFPEWAKVTSGIIIPIEAVYTNTTYTNYFRDFDVGFQPGIYMFTTGDQMLYIGSSYSLADRLRNHILNYQRTGIGTRSPFVGYTERIAVFETKDYIGLEKELINRFSPIWNNYKFS